MSTPEHVGEPVADDGLLTPARSSPSPAPSRPADDDGSRTVPALSPGSQTWQAAAEAPRGAVTAGIAAATQVREEGTGLGRLAATVERLRGEIRAAQAAADGRALIELAKGVLIERLQCGPAVAAQQLAALADESGVSQLELAADIVNQAAHDHVTDVANDFVQRTNGETSAAEDSTSVGVRLRTAESGALAAGDTQAVAESLLEHALTPLGANAVAVWTAGSDASLTLAGHAGFPTDEAGRWRYVPPGVSTLARQALAERQAVRVASWSAAGLPSIGWAQNPSGGRVALPAGTGGRVHGILEICWPGPLEPQPPQIVRQIEALAELCAHTLEGRPGAAASPRGHSWTTRPDLSELVDLAEGLYDPALVLVPFLEPDGQLADFRIHHANSHFVDPAGRSRSAVNGALLLEAYPMAVGGSELFEKIERVYATGEPFRAQRMTLTALVDQVPLASVADISVSRHGSSVLLIWRVEDETARLASLLQHAQRLGRIGGFEENVATGEITWNDQLFDLYGRTPNTSPVPLEELTAHAHPDDAVTIGRFLRAVLHHRRPASAAFRLQRPDGVTRHIRVIAEPVLDADHRMLAVRGAYQDISAQHWTEVALAATRDQLAHTEQQAAERNRMTLQLQHAIMPPAQAPLDSPGLQIAVRYRPAESESMVGGDWYDAVVLPSKKIMLCVGDVAGHGIEAATSMVVLRNAMRGLAVTGAGPGQLLSWLNTVAHYLTEHVTATAVCGLYDPEQHTLRWARAGHLPPVLIRGQKATTLRTVSGILLGALSETTYEEEELQMEPGDTLLMYTDGLVERRDQSVQDSLAQLLTNARIPTTTLEQRLDGLLTHSKSDTDDDTCLIGVQVL
ncbi:GAF domain-containing SpoIIE family protein phosphatase [Streptomyces sp. CB03238]|uniref:GAF domain-containing SpoIIE family protein phosphatase n=1 Tax=Streptomyces sp. CB03238 TaxID=1907777 RepID=UPI001F4DE4A0|nr:GAF domain-containing SpoIIE family protein phosphatase [Streptomyces sp. CB03238]